MADPQGGHGVQTASAHRPSARRDVGDGDGGGESGHGAHEQRSRPQVQPQPVLHDDLKGVPRGLGSRPGRRQRLGGGRRVGRRRREVRGLGSQRAARLRGDLLQRIAEPGGDRRGHGALHERRLREQNALAPLPREQVQGQVRREDGAAEVHQDQNAVFRPHLLDGPRDARRVGAERVAGLIQPAGDPDPQASPAHLGGQLGHALGELGAVADEDQPDHGYAPGTSAGAPAANVSAAVCSSSHEEVAPGS